MRSGFDRIATPEELSQVLAVLDELARNAWLPAESQLQETNSPAALWADDMHTDTSDSDEESLAEFICDKSALKN